MARLGRPPESTMAITTFSQPVPALGAADNSQAQLEYIDQAHRNTVIICRGHRKPAAPDQKEGLRPQQIHAWFDLIAGRKKNAS